MRDMEEEKEDYQFMDHLEHNKEKREIDTLIY